MKLFKWICGVVLCAGLCCIIAGGGIFFARRDTAANEKKIKTLPTYRLSTFTEIPERHSLTLCAAGGLSAAMPENTCLSIRAAGEEGFRYVLLDTAMTRDHVPVLLADDTLARMTACTSPVRAVDLDTLRTFPLDNGAGIDTQEAPVYIPTLAEALTVCAEYEMTPILNVRTMRGMTQLQSVLHQFDRPYLVSSSEKAVLDAFHGTDCARLYRTGALTPQSLRYAQKKDCGLLFDAQQTRPEQIPASCDLPLWAETVRSRTLLDQLAAGGIRNIVTDCILPIK